MRVKKYFFRAATAVLLSACISFLGVSSSYAENSPKPDEVFDVMIRCKSDDLYEDPEAAAEETQRSLLELLKEEKQAGLVEEYESFYISNAVHALIKSEELINKIKALPEVESVEDNGDVFLINPMPDLERADHIYMPGADGIEWGVKAVHADKVWQEFNIDGDGVTVGIIDTGVNYKLDTLKKSFKGYDEASGTFDNSYYKDCIEEYKKEPEAVPDNDHGTFVAGIICGSGEGNKNRTGVAPGVKFISARAISSKGGKTSDVLEAAQWMLEQKPDIINNSWGGYPKNQRWFEDMARAWRREGITVVFAAGNQGDKEPRPWRGSITNPGSLMDVIAVGAVDIDKRLGWFSKLGPSPLSHDPERYKPDLSAPGVQVRSVDAGGHFTTKNGTSMAAPHVSGVAALLKAADHSLTVDEIEGILKESSERLKDGRFKTTPNMGYGYGLVNAYDAVSMARGQSMGEIYGSISYAGSVRQNSGKANSVYKADTEINPAVNQDMQAQSASPSNAEYRNILEEDAELLNDLKDENHPDKASASNAEYIDTQEAVRNREGELTEYREPVIIEILSSGKRTELDYGETGYSLTHSVNKAGSPLKLHVSSYGYKDSYYDVDLSDGSRKRQDVELIPADKFALSGRIVDSRGRGIAGASVEVVEDAHIDIVFTDNSGRFNIPEIYEGRYSLRIAKFGYVSRTVSAELYGGSSGRITSRQLDTARLSLLEDIREEEIGYGSDPGASGRGRTIYFDNEMKGMAVRFDPPHKAGILKSASIFLVNNNIYRGKHIEIGVLGVDKNERIYEIVPFMQYDGLAVNEWNDIDFSDYFVSMDKPVYIAVRYDNERSREECMGVLFDSNASRTGKKNSYIFDGAFHPVEDFGLNGAYAVRTTWFYGKNEAENKRKEADQRTDVSIPGIESADEINGNPEDRNSPEKKSENSTEKTDGSIPGDSGSENSTEKGSASGGSGLSNTGEKDASSPVNPDSPGNGSSNIPGSPGGAGLRGSGSSGSRGGSKGAGRSGGSGGGSRGGSGGSGGGARSFGGSSAAGAGRKATGGSAAKPGITLVSGSWTQDSAGWHFTESGFGLKRGSWAAIQCSAAASGYAWYYFDETAIMKTGWYQDAAGRFYYMEPEPGALQGAMCTGWKLIAGKWYYFNAETGAEEGKLIVSGRTPDGYTVGADGSWTGR